MLLSIVTSGGSAFAAPDLAAPERPNAFAPLRTLLEGWELTTEFAFSVGTSEGERFRYEGGSMTMNTLVPTASTSKWPSAMMFAGLVADGTISSLDTRVNTILPYWTKDASDPRSAITLRMLLTFTSGFGDGHPGLESNTRVCHGAYPNPNPNPNPYPNPYPNPNPNPNPSPNPNPNPYPNPYPNPNPNPNPNP